MKSTDIHPVIRQHLRGCGVSDENDMHKFLNPQLSDLPHPALMRDMEKATDLVIDAIVNKHQIYIWGDYDVDGITSAALLYTFFSKLGVQSRVYIPDRLTEGYGLNFRKLEEISEESTENKLLISVDCGISNHEEVLYAQKQGFKVIITDHHNVPDKRVGADAVINPKQKSCSFPYKHLAGVGIAFYFAASVKSKLELYGHLTGSCTINMKYFLAFVSIGTVADVMPLDGINRILVRGGFEVIAGEDCPQGLKHLCDRLGVSRKTIAGDSIAFQLAPTINSAGRLGEPFTAFTALVDNSSVGEKAAQALALLNKKRKKMCSEECEYALTKIRNSSYIRDNSIVVHGDFNDGLMGITASRLVEKFNLPTIVFCEDRSEPGMIKGSGRAPEHFDLYKVICSCSRFLKKFGGHSAAAGMTLSKEYFDLFATAFEENAVIMNDYRKQNKPGLNNNQSSIDLSVSEALDPVLVRNIFQLEPLGEANPRPIFLDNDAQFVSVAFFGNKNEHVRGVLRGKYRNVPILGFSIADKIHRVKGNDKFSLVYSHMLDGYNGSNTWKLKIHDAWL